MERELLSRRAYAKRRGVSHTAVNSAVRSGRIAAALVKLGDGRELVDVAAADILWKANSDPSQQRAAPVPEPAAVEAPPAIAPAASSEKPGPVTVKPGQDLFGQAIVPEEPKDENAGAPKPGTFAYARARREMANAEIAEINSRQRKESVVSLDRARSLFFQSMRTVRDNLQGIGVRVAPDFAAETDPHKIQQRFDDEIEAALREMSDGPPI